MELRVPSAIVTGLLLFGACPLWGQEGIRLKTGRVAAGDDRRAHLGSPLKRRTEGRSHFLIRWDDRSNEARTTLENNGLVLLRDVPGGAAMVSAPDGFDWDQAAVRWVGRLVASDKISPLLTDEQLPPPDQAYVVEFHPDTAAETAGALIDELGLERLEHPDLVAGQSLVRGEFGIVSRLSEWDEVAYLFPASDELVRGERVVGCVGALTANGLAGSYVKVGIGWPRVNGTVSLGVALGAMTTKLPLTVAQQEILRGLNEWTRYAPIRFTTGAEAGAARTLSVFFARAAHGDVYPFDGPGQVLAHTFYPAPPNAEPVAGDMHLDDDEWWRVGANTDLFSVALHEAGHALGLGHTDKPGAVMYPYYKIVTGLAVDDIAGIQDLYGAAAGTPAAPPVDPPPPSPSPAPSLVIGSPAGAAVSTPSAAIALSGTVAGGTAPVRVSWTNDRGGSGVASGGALWSVAKVDLQAGGNRITVTAADGAGRSSTRMVTVTRTPVKPVPDLTAPSLTIVSPPLTVVATTGAALQFTGTASDDVGVTAVTWATSDGRAGAATGTARWSAAAPLNVGSNTVTIRAWDAAGNSTWRSVRVVRR